MKYQLLDHRTDLEIKVFGPGLKGLFANSCLAMSESLLPQPLDQYQEKKRRVTVEVKGNTPEDLLVNFLSEILYLSDINNCLYQVEKFVSFSDKKLKAKLIGCRVPADQLKTEIKAVTHHGLKIEKKNNQFETTIIFDI